MNKLLLLISMCICSQNPIFSQSLIGMKKHYIETDMINIGGVKIDTIFSEKDTSDIYLFKEPNPMLEIYFFNSYNVAYSVMYVIYDINLMEEKIRFMNKEYIPKGELSWSYYFNGMKLNVNLTKNTTQSSFSVIYNNPKLNDLFPPEIKF